MDHLQALTEWLNLYGYPILFLAVLAENTGLPVPGETAVLTASMLASHSGSRLSLVGIILVTVLAAVLGDNLGFWLGRRWARGRLEQGKNFLFLTPKTLQTIEGYFAHYGVLTVFFARFVAGLRVVAGVAAGTSRMAWLRFFLANAAGAIAWAVSMLMLGYFGGQSWQALHRRLGRGGLIILGCVVLLVGLAYLWRHARRLPADSWDRLLRSQVWRGLLGAILLVVCVAVLVVLAEHHKEPPHQDRGVRDWIAARRVPWLDALTIGGSYLGSLPVVVFLAALLLVSLWCVGRPWRETVALVAVLIVGEGVGLLLLALLRHHGIETAHALAWPFGFAGLAPLRGAAAYGMMGHVLGRHFPTWRRTLGGLTLLLILLIGFSVVWSQEQILTEVLIEYVAGSVVLFIGLWWLEKYGFGPQPGPASGQPV